MNDDELMDQLLRDTMAASGEAPQLPATFDATVMARVRGRSLTAWGRVVMGAYTIAAVAALAWAMQDISVGLIAASAVAAAMAAFGLSSYVRAVAIPADVAGGLQPAGSKR